MKRESLSVNPYALPNFIVGADANIGPMGSCEFAEDYRKTGAFCRADVGIGPYIEMSRCIRTRCDFSVNQCILPGGTVGIGPYSQMGELFILRNHRWCGMIDK